MKKQIKTMAVVAALVAGLGLNNFAMAKSAKPAPCYKVAIVNVQQVVEASAQVQELKKEQQAKMQDLQKWITTVRADVAKQPTQDAKDKLIKKYDSEFARKQDVIRKEYTAKLQEIDKAISTVITEEAQAEGYDLVLTKSIVLFGGEDITDAVAKKVK